MKNMKKFVGTLIRNSIVGFVVGIIIVKFIAPVLELKGDLGIAISAAIGAVIVITIIEIRESSKEKQLKQEGEN